MNNKYFIANWKSYLTYNQEIEWVKNNLEDLQSLKNEIIICPSFLSLNSIKTLLNNSNIKTGAQTCSQFNPGAYTGEITAQSLAQVRVSYCIVGHSERRQNFNENEIAIVQKVKLLVENQIVPILCIGETRQEYEQKQSKEALQKQLEPVLNLAIENLIIAYEPVWSIGTGITPSNEYIEHMATFIKEIIKNKNSQVKYKIVYGGSITSKTATELNKCNLIDGFLIGKASTDFQKFKKIVLL